MRKKKSITLSNKPTYQGYSYAFKVAIIERIENGQISISQAAREYDVSPSGIRKWVKKYGNLDKKLRGMGGKSPQQEIADLKKKLKLSEKKVFVLESTIEFLEEDFKIDAKKKYLSAYQRSVLKDINKKLQ